MIQPLAMRRSGFSMVELVVSMVILASLISGILPIVHWYRRELRSRAQQELAASELENLMQLAVATDWQNVTTQRLGQLQMSPEVARRLPNYSFLAAVESDGMGKQIVLTLQDLSSNRKRVRPLKLIAWVYPDKEPDDATGDNGKSTSDPGELVSPVNEASSETTHKSQVEHQP